jgi:hypothetical protein
MQERRSVTLRYTQTPTPPIGFLEKRNGTLRVIHNKGGVLADENLFSSRFFNSDGSSAFTGMALFAPGRN